MLAARRAGLMVWTGKPGGFSQTQSRLWVLANDRFANGYFENKGRKFLFPGNHFHSWEGYSFGKVIPSNKNTGTPRCTRLRFIALCSALFFDQ